MSKLLRFISVSVSALTATCLIAGCASTSLNPVATPSPTPSPSATAMSPSEAKAAFKQIAQDSCSAAQSLGVVEAGDTWRTVSVNKNENYKDFSAAYFEEPDSYKLIWELDALHSCADWYSFSMADEAGQEAPIEVSFDPTDSTFTTFEDFGEFGTSNYKYSVKDGKLFTATNLDPQRQMQVTIEYGNISENDRNILVIAVDRYLEENE